MSTKFVAMARIMSVFHIEFAKLRFFSTLPGDMISLIRHPSGRTAKRASLAAARLRKH
ncbi:hypothetical protein PSAC2689_10347 [Paraburkholderia sacchari]|uniref:hypothetical protein n=1 Tax=Paraburkholderia sacchari TaxID=159450 RepID=UPI0039A6AF69